MSQKELNRLPVLQQLRDRCLTQIAAARLLNISVRQVQRLLVRYLASGAAGISSRKRGQPANNRVSDDLKLCVLALLRENYIYMSDGMKICSFNPPIKKALKPNIAGEVTVPIILSL